MKARVKATGEIIEVKGVYTSNIRTFGIEEIESYNMKEVEIITGPDYYTRLEHQYAGMAMQGILGNQTYTNNLLETSTSANDARDIIVGASWYLAQALVEKMKEESK